MQAIRIQLEHLETDFAYEWNEHVNAKKITLSLFGRKDFTVKQGKTIYWMSFSNRQRKI